MKECDSSDIIGNEPEDDGPAVLANEVASQDHAPTVPKDKQHADCIANILSLDNLFSAPHVESKNEFEVAKIHAGDSDKNFARIFFDLGDNNVDSEVIAKTKQALLDLTKSVNDKASLNKGILKNIKSIVVDRTKIEGYSEGRANDEIDFDDDKYVLTDISFYKKPQGERVSALCGNTVCNKIMVLRYKHNNRNEEFIVDMDNNLILTNHFLNGYWHSKNKKEYKGTGFDDKDTPVYIDSTTGTPAYHHFRINNAITMANDDKDFYESAMKQISDNKLMYKINYVYNTKRRMNECTLSYNIGQWQKDVNDFLTEKQREFNKIIGPKTENINDKRKRIQKFCNDFKNYLLGHEQEAGEAYNNIIMTTEKDSNDKYMTLAKLMQECSKEGNKNKTQEIVYGVFEKINQFVNQIKNTVGTIEKNEINNVQMESDNVIDSTNGKTELFYNNLKKVDVNKNVTKFENEAQDKRCKCNYCNFALPNCLRNCFGK